MSDKKVNDNSLCRLHIVNSRTNDLGQTDLSLTLRQWMIKILKRIHKNRSGHLSPQESTFYFLYHHRDRIPTTHLTYRTLIKFPTDGTSLVVRFIIYNTKLRGTIIHNSVPNCNLIISVMFNLYEYVLRNDLKWKHNFLKKVTGEIE